MNSETTERLTAEEVLAFVGSNAAWYLDRWSPLDKGGRVSMGFNWAAFFFSNLWLGYRKMYGVVALVVGLFVGVSVVEALIFVGILGMAGPPALIEWGFLLAFAVICGIFGNRWYYRYTAAAIGKVARSEPDEKARGLLVARRGGTSIMGAIASGLLWLLAGVVAGGLALVVFTILGLDTDFLFPLRE